MPAILLAFQALSFSSAALAFFIALPLLLRRHDRSTQAWLGLFALAVSLLSLSGTVLVYNQPALIGLLDWPVTCLGPCFYLYVRGMVGRGLGRRPWLHFLPLAGYCGWLIWIRFNPSPNDFATLESLGMASEVLATVYALVAAWYLHRYRHQLQANYSSLVGRDLLWLSWLCAVVISILAICVLASVFGGVWIWLLAAQRLVILYFLGWYGLRQRVVANPDPLQPEATAPQASQSQTDGPGEPSAAVASDDTEKYARSGMTEAAQALIASRLAERMAARRDHLESDLTLAELATRIGTSPQLLSQYLNHTLGLSFFDYVNGLRVAEVQGLLADPARGKVPVLDLAFEAGFNSKSTFNAAFRRVSGVTPSEWRRQTPGQPGENVRADPRGRVRTPGSQDLRS